MKKKSRTSLGTTALFIHILILLFFTLYCPVVHGQQNWQYTVQPGDNLWILSKKHLKSMQYWKQLVELNNVADPYNIPPGTMLKFPLEWLKSGASVASVIAFEGNVTVIKRGADKKVAVVKNLLLWGGDTIHTGPSSNVTLLFTDSSRTLIQSSSEMKIESLESYGATGMAKIKTKLKQGRTHNRVIPRTGPGSRFEITTPSAIAAVRGTEYRISASPDGTTRTEVLRGSVGVDSATKQHIVKEGYGTVSSKDEGSITPVKLLPAPNISKFPTLVERVPFPLLIPPIQGAVDYRLQISKDSHFNSLIYDSIFPTGSMWGPDIPDGNYYLRTHGIDGKGLEGFDSVHRFTVAAHPIPPMLMNPAEDAEVFEEKPEFQWSKPEEAHQYVFELARDEAFNEPLIINKKKLSETGYSPDSPIGPGLYYWRLASVTEQGKTGPYSDPQKFRRPPPSPNMEGSALDKDIMLFRWRSGDEDHAFRCQISRKDDFSELLDEADLDVPEYSIKKFAPGNYYIRIAIIDTDGYAGPYGKYQMVTVPMPPVNPFALLTPVVLIVLIAL